MKKIVRILTFCFIYAFCGCTSNANPNNQSTPVQEKKDSIGTKTERMNASFLNVKIGDGRTTTLSVLERQGLQPEENSNMAIELNENFSFGSHPFDFAVFRIEDEKVFDMYGSSAPCYEKSQAYSTYTDLKAKFLKKYGKYKVKEGEWDKKKKYEVLCSNVLEFIEFSDGDIKISVEYTYFKTDKKPGDEVIDDWDRDDWFTAIRIEPCDSNQEIDDIK